MTNHYKPTNVHKDQVSWNFEYNGMKVRAVKKRDKFGDLVGKTFLYTDGDSGAYYATTALAVFSQKFLLEQLLDIKLETPKELTVF